MKPAPAPKSRRRAAALAFAAAALVAAATCAARRTFAFAAAVDLPLYDALTVLTWPWPAGHPDVVLVTIHDHRSWPLSDAALARSLEIILAGQPTCIGVDLKRDAYRPDAAGSESLYQLARARPDVLWVCGLSGPGSFGPPPFLEGLDEEELALRCPLADFPADPGEVVRRGFVSAEETMSLAAVQANLHAALAEPARAEELAGQFDRIGSLPRDAGGYQLRPIAGAPGIGAQFLLKFAPRVDALFPDVPLRQVLAGRPPPVPARQQDHAMAVYPVEDLPALADDPGALRRCFGGRIVLLGTHDPDTAEDEKEVPGNPPLRGVKLHALATAQLLRELDGEAPIRFVADPLEDLAVVLAALLGAAAVWFVRLPPLWKSFLIPFGLPAALFGVAVAAMGRGLWFPPGAPMLAAFGASTAALAVLLRSEGRERRAVYQVLERTVGRDLAGMVWSCNEELLRDGEVPAESFPVTVLFADLRGYSKISEEFDDSGRIKEFIAWLNNYLRSMVAAVHGHRGFIKAFAGDGIFVVFGFPPQGNEQHPLLAVECARAMGREIRRLNAALPPGAPPYQARVGIYTGPVHAAPIGSPDQFEYAFLGPTTNKGARLEGLRKDLFRPELSPIRILVSESTHAALPAGIPLRPFGEGSLELDAGGEPELVWEILTDDENDPQVP